MTKLSSVFTVSDRDRCSVSLEEHTLIVERGLSQGLANKIVEKMEIEQLQASTVTSYKATFHLLTDEELQEVKNAAVLAYSRNQMELVRKYSCHVLGGDAWRGIPGV